MRKLLGVLAVLLASAALTHAAKNPSIAAEARTAVQTELNDPAAAFERLNAQKDAVCGVVEAKNGAGADTGRMLFVYIRAERKAYVLNSVPERSAESEAEAVGKYQAHCQR